jgi:hypothetical protein
VVKEKKMVVNSEIDKNMNMKNMDMKKKDLKKTGMRTWA